MGALRLFCFLFSFTHFIPAHDLDCFNQLVVSFQRFLVQLLTGQGTLNLWGKRVQPHLESAGVQVWRESVCGASTLCGFACVSAHAYAIIHCGVREERLQVDTAPKGVWWAVGFCGNDWPSSADSMRPD